MADQILSQEEIDALLSAMDSGEVDVEEEKPREAKIKSYDLTSQGSMLRDQFDALDEIYDKFISLLNNTLQNTLQRAFEVKIASKEVVKFGDFLQAFSNPTGFSIYNMEPLIGSALLAIEPNLVFSLIDCMFGGNGRPLEKIREFTMIEHRMVRRFAGDVLGELEKAWEVAYPVQIHLKKMESKPEFVNLVNPSDLLIIVVFSISNPEFTGNIHVATPYLMLEPIKDKLTSSYLREKDMAHSFRHQLHALLRDTDVQVVAELGRMHCSMRDIMELEVEDVLRLGTGPQDAVQLNVESIPKYFGMPGVVKGNRAVQVTELIESPFETESE
ncbi:MAG: flagellar motor switch protein FliM [Desulfosarcinaceae bacterium]|nr:flagellar motor switch protein FliM [Desulfosarcinaceae bacterium]